MTEDQAQKLIKLVEDYNHLETMTIVFSSLLMIILILFAILEIYRFQKVQKYVKEYKATLNEEQLETLKRFKKIND